MGLKLIIDFSDADEKRRFCGACHTLDGVHEVQLKKRRETRSLNQNRWYWACIVGPFFDFLASQDYDITSPDDAHEILKAKFLTVHLHDAMGEVIGSRVRSTADLTTEEFSDYCDKCRAWLDDFFHIPTQDPM